MRRSQKSKEQPKNNKLWIRLYLFIVFIAFITAGYNIFKETHKKYQIRKEVDELKAEVKGLEQGNQKIKGLIEYYQTDGFTEKEARKKLNVKKEGEKVVILRKNENQEEDNPTELESNNKEERKDNYTNVSNPSKWWDYFFKEKK